jgi:hypothetical protein
MKKIDLIFNNLRDKETLEVIDLNLEAWRIFHEMSLPEMHDRMIVAAFYNSNAKGIITNNPEISKKVNSIWK